MRVLLDFMKLCCLKTVWSCFCCHATFCHAVFPAACLDCFDQFCKFQSFTNRCKVYIFCCIQRTRRTWGAAAWSWRHFDGRGAVLHPFSQNRRLDQWRNTVTLRRTNVILSDLKSKARRNILTHFVLSESTLLKFNAKMTWANKSQSWLTQSSMLAEQSATTSSTGLTHGWGRTHLIFTGGQGPLSNAAWVVGHLDLTLYIFLVHTFVLIKKP